LRQGTALATTNFPVQSPVPKPLPLNPKNITAGICKELALQFLQMPAFFDTIHPSFLTVHTPETGNRRPVLTPKGKRV